jgi:saccharopine dehydrogenase-like NADP-dependent oxidoreductase
MKSITVLGAGMIGSAIAGDLSRDYNVSVADFDADKLQNISGRYKVEIIAADLLNVDNLNNVIAGADIVVGAMPGFMGFSILRSVINAGKNIVDISFFNENPFLLDQLAKEKNVTAVVDCGVAPGLSNMAVGYHYHLMKVYEFICLVGGLPLIRSMPFQYKAPFSPVDVIEEYTRPARIVENGNIIIKPALSESELIEIDNVGTLEAFNSDGLRTLTETLNIPYMKEKTLRYPGHAAQMQLLKECGFFSRDEIEVKGIKISPMEVTARLLFPLWKYNKGEKDFTYMRMDVKGKAKDKVVHHRYSLFDVCDQSSEISSMARTTAYTCCAVVNLVLNNDFNQIGICPPEYVGGEEKCFKKVLNYLEERNVKVEHEVLSGKESRQEK